MPTKQGEQWAEIGSAPGGASQALLKQGVNVIGIDPAEMDPAVIANPNFTHWKKRGADVRRREFRGVKYLAADINVAPNYTLDTVENIVTHPEVNIRGLLLTLKLLEWKLADELPAYLDRIRGWGYRTVRARQLSHNRQELCVAARR
jgi:23S rRNA (cytidine2498-2'-O)-methyltransferase